jgi:O-antigen ligase
MGHYRETKSVASVLAVVVFLGALIDAPGSLGLGPFSVMGFQTIVYAVCSFALVFVRLTIPKTTSTIGWLVLFLAWGYSSLLWQPSFSVQNLVAYTAFAGLVLLAATESYRAPYLSRYISISFAFATVLFMLLFMLKLLGMPLSIGSRTSALFSLVVLGWCLAGWRYGSRWGLWVAILITATIGASLSRMAFLVALMLFPIARVQPKSFRGWVLVCFWSVLTAGIMYIAVVYVQALHARFFSGDVSLKIGGLSINASGRMRFWAALLSSWWKSPWIGNGAGSSMQAIVFSTNFKQQPHNDYLRLLHDYGLIGFALWSFGFFGLLWRTFRTWLWAEKNDGACVQIHLAAFLGLVAVSLTMLTDNVSIYIFVMAPVAVLVGTSLGRLSRHRAAAMAEEVPSRVLGAARLHSKCVSEYTASHRPTLDAV